MSNLLARQRPLLAALLDFFLPRDCLLCGEGGVADVLCPPCACALPRACGRACEICALPHAGPRCGSCLSRRPSFDHTLAAFDYAFPLDVLLHAFKYRGQMALLPLFVDALGSAAGNLLGAADLVVPMPLHRRRLRARGFNQALELARPLARLSGSRLELELVRKLRHTPPQASLERAQRLRSPRAAFVCTATLEGLHVVVVDDVMTTGASLEALAHTLKAAGAARVSNVVLARTPRPS